MVTGGFGSWGGASAELIPVHSHGVESGMGRHGINKGSESAILRSGADLTGLRVCRR